MKTCALLSALVLASASEDTFTDDGLSLLQLRATTQGNLNDDQSPCLCSIVVDTATQGNAETGGGGVGQWLIDGIWTDKQQFLMTSGSKSISSGAQVATPPERLPGPGDGSMPPTAVKLTASTGDGWGYKKVSINCGQGQGVGQVLVLLDSPNGAPYAGAATPEYWVDLPSSVHSSKEYAITGALAAQVTSCSPPTTTPLPTEAPDVLNYPVGHGYGQVTSEEGCRDLATQWGMELGGGGFAFSGGYSNKGCYTYNSGAFACKAFYGKGGDEAAQLRNFPADDKLSRLGSGAQAQCAPNWTPPGDEASATGDPHLITNTGKHYDYTTK